MKWENMKFSLHSRGFFFPQETHHLYVCIYIKTGNSLSQKSSCNPVRS